MESKNKTLNNMINEYIRVLEQNGIDDARNNVMTLVEFVLGCSRSKITALSNDLFDNVFLPEQKLQLEECLLRRMKNEPLQYIVGETEFMGMTFCVSPDVLIPRQDTEVLVEKVLEYAEQLAKTGRADIDASELAAEKANAKKIRILDMCTGSGCIAVSLAAFIEERFCKKNCLKTDDAAVDISVTAVDISEAAIKMAKHNARLNHVEDIVTFVQSDLFEEFRVESSRGGDVRVKAFDIIVSNPPYIPSEDCKTLQDEVLSEPLMALDGGVTGLDFYRRLISEGRDFLAENGAMFFEFGIGQDAELREMASAVFDDVDIYEDYAKIPRVIRMKNGK